MRQAARGVRFTSDDLAGTHLATFEGGALFCGQLSERQVADWRRARFGTPLRLGRDRSLGALRVANFLEKHADFWSEEVVREIVARSSSVEDIEAFASSLHPDMAQDVMVAWHRTLARLSEQLVSECTLVARDTRSPVNRVNPLWSVHMTFPRSLALLRSNRTRNDGGLREVQIVDLSPADCESQDYVEINLSDASVHPALRRFCLRQITLSPEFWSPAQQSSATPSKLAFDLPMLAAKNWVDSQAGVQGLQGGRACNAHQLAMIAFFANEFVSVVRALPDKLRPAAAPVVPSCEAIMQSPRMPPFVWLEGSFDHASSRVKSTLLAVLMIAATSGVRQNLKRYVEDDNSLALRSSWITSNSKTMGVHGDLPSLYSLRIWLAIRDLFFPTEG